VRELLGAGKLFNFQVMPDFYTPIGIFVLAPGAFFVLAALAAIQNYVRDKKGGKKNSASSMHMGCMGDCNNCSVEHLEAVDQVAHNKKEQPAKSNPKDAKRKGKEE
jgi:hypothetical protein